MAVSACGIGYLRPASGSWGSLPPVAIVIACAASESPSWVLTVTLLLLVVLGSIACIRFGAEAERGFGAKDPSSVVADEVAGCALTLAVVPWGMISPDGTVDLLRVSFVAGAGFVAFRLFDVWKPGIVRSLQDREGGSGILLDDLGAAVCAWPVVLAAAAVARAISTNPFGL
ncbi:MAG: phosphatidylglycerophosphatase A [Phycisphaerales bacterium]|nr:phosphatidylglycerophosphatase A [Phycisphaerales bacterium]